MRRWAPCLALALVLAAGCSSKKSGTAATTVPTTSNPNSKYCRVATQFSQIAIQNVTTDPKTIFQEFDSLAGPYQAASPPAIHDDVALVIGDIQQLETAAKATNYDLTALARNNPGALTPFQAPAFAAAVGRINSYNSQACGLTAQTTPTS